MNSAGGLYEPTGDPEDRAVRDTSGMSSEQQSWVAGVVKKVDDQGSSDAEDPASFGSAEVPAGAVTDPRHAEVDNLAFTEEPGKLSGSLKVDLDALRAFKAAIAAAIDRFDAPGLSARLTSAGGTASGSHVEPGQFFNAAEEFRAHYMGSPDTTVPGAYAGAITDVNDATQTMLDWVDTIINNYQSGDESTQLEIGELRDLFEGKSGVVAQTDGAVQDLADVKGFDGASADGTFGEA